MAEEKKDSKKDNSKIVSIALAVAGVIAIIWIIYLKNSKPEDSIVLPVVIVVILAVAFVISSFGKSITKQLKSFKLNSIKKVLTEVEITDMVYKIVEGTAEKKFKDGMFRNIKRIEDKRSKEVGGDEIYAILVRLSYPIKFGEKEEDGLWIVINATHQSKMPSILKEGTENLENEINFKSRNYRDPTTTEETTKNELLGFESHKKTVTPSSDEKADDDEEAGL